jgi:hypothetical protein
LRRDGCPLEVRDGAGTVYVEGKDFAELRDPKMGRVPWPGSYEVWHEPPQLKVLPNSRIRNGQTLRVDFSHTVTIYDNQVTCCLGHPQVFRPIGRSSSPRGGAFLAQDVFPFAR